MRTPQTAATTYYVDAAGSDANPGTAALPWATVTHAWKYLQANVDAAGFDVTIIASGNTAPFCLEGPLVGTSGARSVFVKGASWSQVSASSGDAIALLYGAAATVSDFSVGAGGAAGHGVYADLSTLILGQMCHRYSDQAHIYAVGANINIQGDQTLFGAAAAHVLAEAGAIIQYQNVACTVLAAAQGGVNTYNFGYAFAMANELSQIDFTNTSFQVLAAVTGKRYHAETCSVIKGSFTAGGLQIPGNVAGAVPYGGVYR